MSWHDYFPLRFIWYALGLCFLASGLALVITAGLGAGPWDLFHLGVRQRIGGSIGLIMQATGLLVICLNMALSIRPSLGMVLNMLTVGPTVQLLLQLLPTPSTVPSQWVMLLGGIFSAGFGIAVYVSAGIGSGPRDGLMIGLTRKTNLPVGLIKNGLDLTIALIGWRLGGPLGIGTIIMALGLGPSVQTSMAFTRWLASHAALKPMIRPVNLKRI